MSFKKYNENSRENLKWWICKIWHSTNMNSKKRSQRKRQEKTINIYEPFPDSPVPSKKTKVSNKVCLSGYFKCQGQSEEHLKLKDPHLPPKKVIYKWIRNHNDNK